MDEQRRQCEQQRGSGQHDDHLCYLIATGFALSDEQEYRALIAEPRYRCNHCGRTAKSNVNLCVPGDL
jgi:hypothetical protein